MPGKYTPLEKYLASQPAAIHNLTLTFAQVERIIGEKLPISAWKHGAWWSNEQDGVHVNAHAWMHAGWRVDSIGQKKGWVRFRRR